MIPYIIILGAGENQLPFILESKIMGYKTIVFDRDDTKIGASVADLFYPLSIYESSKILDLLETLNLSYHAIIARVTSVEGLQTGYIIAKHYNLIFPSQLLIQLGTNKTFLSEFCVSQNISIPLTQFIKENQELTSLLFKENSNYIVKPSMTTIGKKNIIKVSTSNELHNAFLQAKLVSANKEVLVQEYVQGVDTTILTAFKDNKFNIIASWDEIIGLDKKNHIKGLGIKTPSFHNTNDKVKEKIDSILKTFCQILDNENYLIAFSFKIKNENEIYLIEIHIDLTGDQIAEKLLPASNNKFNFCHLVLNHLQNKNQKTGYTFKDTILLYNEQKPKDYDKAQIINTLEKMTNSYQLQKIEYLNYLKRS